LYFFKKKFVFEAISIVLLLYFGSSFLVKGMKSVYQNTLSFLFLFF